MIPWRRKRLKLDELMALPPREQVRWLEARGMVERGLGYKLDHLEEELYDTDRDGNPWPKDAR